MKAVNPSEDISTYVSKENEVKIIRSKYTAETGEFLVLYEIVGFMIVRGSPDEVFFNYGYDKDKSKVLYSHYRRRIPNSFSGTIFNRHRAMIETGEIDSEFSNIYFFLPSITDRTEDINQYLISVSISPIGITQKQFDDWAGVNLTLQSLICLVLTKVSCLVLLFNVSGTSTMFRIAIWSETLTRFCFRKKLKCLWTGSETLRNV